MTWSCNNTDEEKDFHNNYLRLMSASYIIDQLAYWANIKSTVVLWFIFEEVFMADKVKLSKDGNSIDFVQSEGMPTSIKKFRQSPEIEGFYRFIFENDLQKKPMIFWIES